MILIHSQLISVNGKLIQIDELLMQKMIFQVRPILPLSRILTVTERDDYTPHETRWQCTVKKFYYGVSDAYRLKLT